MYTLQPLEGLSMRTLLLIVAVLAIASSGLAFVSAKSAIHEIGAMVLGLNGLVCLIGAALLQAVNRLQPEQPTEATHGRCEECDEVVRKAAKRCPHCGAAQVKA
jgi:hypothetical protein